MRAYLTISGTVFSLIAALHVVRLWVHWPAHIAEYAVPFWVSWAAVLGSGALSVWAFRLVRRAPPAP